jgi:hypothetical protein
LRKRVSFKHRGHSRRRKCPSTSTDAGIVELSPRDWKASVPQARNGSVPPVEVVIWKSSYPPLFISPPSTVCSRNKLAADELRGVRPHLVRREVPVERNKPGEKGSTQGTPHSVSRSMGLLLAHGRKSRLRCAVRPAKSQREAESIRRPIHSEVYRMPRSDVGGGSP